MGIDKSKKLAMERLSGLQTTNDTNSGVSSRGNSKSTASSDKSGKK
ncbi:hypothetical protein [Sporomusa sp.]|nr:hypothetical protein [Sporomusa sp.]HWR43238.1 hypothetical protein [Sporomusa sp.]